MQTQSTGARLNRILYGLSKRWLRVILIIIGVYISLPFAAPVLMRLGANQPAYAIYGMYSPLCHQFAFRSWFLFGEQTAYPRQSANNSTYRPTDVVFGVSRLSASRWSANVPGYRSIEDYATNFTAGKSIPPDTNLAAWTPFLLETAKEFIGDSRMGWKVALCERDVAIYGALFLGGLIFSIPLLRNRLRPIPIWLYFILGILPIALDGGIQLLSEPPIALFAARETTPLFRTLTGGLFGLMNAWLAFPYLEESFRLTRAEIEEKFARKGKAL